MKRRFEIATSGADEGLQGLSSDPFGGAGTPVATGLRIPSLVNTPTTRYLALLATKVITTKTKVCGIRQGLEIGLDLGPQLQIVQQRPMTMCVVTPTFRFSDGANVSWHLVREPMPLRVGQRPKTDTDSWTYQAADTPSFLYDDFIASQTTLMGQPINYALNLTSYTPPRFVGDFQNIAGLKSIRDIRYPWTATGWNSIDEEVTGICRVSLYASILQTDPLNRPGTVFGEGITTNGSAEGSAPEENFIAKYTFTETETTPAAGPQFWRVYGSILFEDEVGR
jgi:hypothetical protein